MTSNKETVVMLGSKIFRRDLNSVALIRICTKSILDSFAAVFRDVKQRLPQLLRWGGGGEGGALRDIPKRNDRTGY